MAETQKARAIRQTRAILESDRHRWSRLPSGYSTMCEGHQYKPHECHGRLEMNEVLIPRRVFQKLDPKRQAYFFHPINCSLNCSWFHTMYGHTRGWRDWFRTHVEGIYGKEAVDAFLAGAPLKLHMV